MIITQQDLDTTRATLEAINLHTEEHEPWAVGSIAEAESVLHGASWDAASYGS